MLHGLKLPAFANTFSELALKASREGLSHEAFLYELARLECEQRLQRRTARQLHQSKLPPDKTFMGFEVDRLGPALRLQLERLREGSFVEEAINVVAIGGPGVGKSHLVCALGHELIQQGHSVLWI